MIKKLGAMIDCSRNSVMTVEAAKRFLDKISPMGYNVLELYTEDTYEVNGEPLFGCLRGRYSKAELKELDAYALSKGVILKPCIQTLAHLNCLFVWDEYNGIRDIDDILLVDEERTYELIERMFSTLAECFTAREVNIGMDEAHRLGRGKYLDRHGYTPPVELMQRHLKRVLRIAEKYGFSCEMWGDMFYNMAYGASVVSEEHIQSVAAAIPKNLKLIYWEYYGLQKEDYVKKIAEYKKLTKNLAFAGGALTWMGFCPDNGYSLAASEQAFRACEEVGIEEGYVTMWGDDGGECSPFAALPALVAVSEYAKDNYDKTLIGAKFEQMMGIAFSDFCLLDEPNHAVPCAELKCSDAAKYLLYNDVFLGRENRAAVAGRREYFRNLAETLSRKAAHEEYGYLFKMEETLCRVLELKYDFGVRLRSAYIEDERENLKKLSEELSEIQIRLKTFYDAFERYWMKDKKPQGFDVQDIRLGGLMQRIEHCKNRLCGYLNGEIAALAEIEETPPDGALSPAERYYRYYRIAATANPI